MLGLIIALIVLMAILIAVFYYLRRCHEGHGGVLCKLWSWLM
jgi:septation ring formation regulator EzrA